MAIDFIFNFGSVEILFGICLIKGKDFIFLLKVELFQKIFGIQSQAALVCV